MGVVTETRHTQPHFYSRPRPLFVIHIAIHPGLYSKEASIRGNTVHVYVYYVIGRATQSVLLLRALGMAEPLALVATVTRGHLVTKGVGGMG